MSRRMTFATDYAVYKDRVDQMSKAMAADKLECQRAIRRLEREIGDLRKIQQERPL